MVTKEMQKAEAKIRLKKLRVLPEIIGEIDRDILYYSERVNTMLDAILYWVNNKPELVDKIKQIEETYGLYVYHVQLSHMEFGNLWSFLYVSGREEEWEMERVSLDEMMPWVYCWNENDDSCSEFGSIQIKSSMGGVTRII